MPSAIRVITLLCLALPAMADEQEVGTVPPPTLPEGVTRLEHPRATRIVLAEGNEIVALPVGEDAEFLWVVVEGAMARVRKADIVTMVATPDRAAEPDEFVRPPAPQAPQTAEPPRDGAAPDDFVRPPDDFVRPPTPRRGRGMTIWGSLLFVGGYAPAVWMALSEPSRHDGLSLLRLIPVLGPLAYALSTDSNESSQWILDGGVQALGALLLTLGIRQLTSTGSRALARGEPILTVVMARDGAATAATWPIDL